MPSICLAPGCVEPRKYKTGLCNKHNRRFERTGSLDLLPRKAKPVYSYNARKDCIAENIEALRLARNWTVAELSRQSGLANCVVYRANDPTLNTLRALGAAFNVDYWRLLIPGEFTKEST